MFWDWIMLCSLGCPEIDYRWGCPQNYCGAQAILKYRAAQSSLELVAILLLSSSARFGWGLLWPAGSRQIWSWLWAVEEHNLPNSTWEWQHFITDWLWGVAIREFHISPQWRLGCPVFISDAVINTMTKSHLRRKWFIWLTAYSPLSREGKAGTWRQELKKKPWKDAAYWLVPLDLPSLFPYTTQDYLPGITQSKPVNNQVNFP